MIADTHIGEIINTDMHNIGTVIIDNSKAQDIDKAEQLDGQEFFLSRFCGTHVLIIVHQNIPRA